MSLRMLGIAALALGLRAGDLRAQIAVVVNKSNAIESLSMEEVRRAFLGKTLSFKDGARVHVAEHTASQRAFFHELAGLTPDDVRRRWVQLIFRGETGTPPREYATSAEVLRFVAGDPGGIGFVDAASLDPSVKVVAVDGKRPTDAGYPIR